MHVIDRQLAAAAAAAAISLRDQCNATSAHMHQLTVQLRQSSLPSPPVCLSVCHTLKHSLQRVRLSTVGRPVRYST